jgi:SpoIID/LytB domain protein
MRNPIPCFQKLSSVWSRALPLAAMALAVSAVPTWAQTPLNPEIKVGIVQRFGENVSQKITLEPLSGDQLTVKFATGDQVQTLTSGKVVLELGEETLPTPVLQEWVVLSTHRSFESAEDSALRWKAAGIETEIAQPNAWQVWAKREQYSTPLVRRLLVENLHAKGFSTVYIDSRVLTKIPKAAFVANGYRYNRDVFNITTGNRRVQMTMGSSTQKELYAGDLRVQPNAYGTYTVVNQVPIELYLRGVVPHEIGPSAPQRAVEAQAVLARTYALRNLRRFAIDNYEMCADTQCQVYVGLRGTDPEADSAIATTRGQVLTYNNELVDALYSSTTGGVTARFTDVWNGADRPYLRPVIDSVQTQWDLVTRPLSNEANFRAFIAIQQGFNEDDWPTFRWDRAGTLEEITAGIKTYLTNRQHPLANLTRVTGLRVTQRSDSGRVQTLVVETDVGPLELHKDEVVKALIPPRSLLFYLEPVYETPAAQKAPGQAAKPAAKQTPGTASTPNTGATPTPSPILKGYRFIGGGFGHGVGLSQTGAYRLGYLGWSHERILAFYYPGTQLKPLGPEIVFWQP